MSDIDSLVERCQRGELAAFTDLFRLYESQAYRLAVTILHDEQDAEDAVQDVFLRVFERVKDYRGQSTFKTWFTSIVVNTCRDKLRRRKVRRALSLDWIRGKASAHDVPGEVDQRQQQEQLWQMVNSLDEKYRLPIILHYVERLPCQEVAQILEIPTSTVYSRLNTAREKLRAASQSAGQPISQSASQAEMLTS
ncbi:MAG: RNA polymerase sigma factor [Ardenticatenaceae bacterium]|nr:RNA polymerase sigma factor [Anaerolineales bacterium]MCB8923935.1 RNA polymerase sigma factor [Ardenticatenaceae bacterium]MCB8990951.1 RNA polymerase sigma factor [Ardenticatenaceae bacterium]MCB9004398.1 RNA polymerase sigma factor [Ardenticatenaceae bacterium]